MVMQLGVLAIRVRYSEQECQLVPPTIVILLQVFSGKLITGHCCFRRHGLAMLPHRTGDSFDVDDSSPLFNNF
jgi:hypothetical protein